ncbi:MAG: hypothetical protein NT026_00430 [Candidatus Staskawiczbacteria bacterium]|nr:hypothetical protein [Candidatus Staskawiczbacteria bacterium]
MDSHSVAQTCGCNNAGAKCGTMTLPGTNTEIPAAITLSMCSSCVKGGSTNPNKKGDGCGPANQPQQTGQVSCGFPQTTCIPGAMFDYCITVGGCQQDFGNPRCPYFDISPCMACGNHCTVGYTGQCTNGGTKTCIEKQAGNPIGKWGSCSGSCSPAGATAQCSDGTNQTCQPNGTWGACNQGCTPPQTDPHNVCTQAGTCISVNGCGTSTDCSACACPAGQTKPYKKCKAGDTAATGPTQVVNECGKDEVCGCAPGTTKDCVCGGTVTCKADGTWPPCPDQHSACTDTGTGLKCQCIDGPGYDACLSLGAQCACGTPGEIVNCTGGGQTSYDKNGTLGNCASHAICNPSNKSCSMTSTSGTDRCQVGIGCGCTPGKVQNCAGGGIQTCNVDGTWGSCPVVACPPTNCDCIEGTQKACPCGGLSTCHNCEYSQCPDKHTKCNTDTGKCECVNGSGAPECDTVGGTCTNCAPDQTICGTNCCNANQICDPDSGTCTSCAENQTVCGTNCCNAGQYCCAGVCSNSACNIPAVKPKIGSGLYCDAATYLGPGIGMVYFKWDYTPVAGHPQSNYRLQISTKGGANFTTGMVFDSSIVSGAGSSVMMRVKPSAVESTNNCKAAHNYDGSIGCHFINYGVSYYWRVKVTDTAGNSSGWVNYADPTNVDDQDSNPWAYKYIYAHPSPYVSYATPTNVAPGTSGTFNDFSVCYDNLGKFYSCKCHDPACVGLSPANILDSCVGGTCYSWWLKIPSGQNIPQYMSSHVADSIAFPDQSGVGPTYGPYTVPGTVGTSLQVCDDIGCCYSPQYMKIGTSGANRAPQYQEVPSL